MNRPTSPHDNNHDDSGFQTPEKSFDDMQSEEIEESKSVIYKRSQFTKAGLYISLTSAQAYSIMRHIPKKFRLIEKTNVKKQVYKPSDELNSPYKKKIKKEIVKPRVRRNREPVKKGDYISSALLNHYEVLNEAVPTPKLARSESQLSRSSRPGRK